MPWRKKGITPMRMPIGKDGLTYDPGLVVETQRLPADGLLMSDIWLSARLTKAGREVIPTGCTAAWQVRLVDEHQPCALLVQLRHNAFGRVIATVPDRVTLPWNGRYLVFLPGRIVPVLRGDPAVAWNTLADALVGTLPPKRYRKRVLPNADLDALSALSA